MVERRMNGIAEGNGCSSLTISGRVGRSGGEGVERSVGVGFMYRSPGAAQRHNF